LAAEPTPSRLPAPRRSPAKSASEGLVLPGDTPTAASSRESAASGIASRFTAELPERRALATLRFRDRDSGLHLGADANADRRAGRGGRGDRVSGSRGGERVDPRALDEVEALGLD